ncbi:isochorismatase family protein [Nocardioides jishulii]|uniref:Isochorismatase family protein n=1 Tax=Nocardioides jishulii TaxID=2575440 RepID=A0A4U2YMF1_9ACTN|nr:isochorismatase family protein [Nocardioides jishulii]QCX27629.1 isochorismatase family protein [Nocardioides jishulii]TKI62436.1 isochorismatase family protein [Nocardioides jishulii]
MDRTQDSAAAGFQGHLGAGDSPALLVIDVCRAYLDPESPLSDTSGRFEAARASASRVVDAAREAGVPVLFTQVVLQPGLADAGWFAKKVPSLKVFEVGNPLGEFPVDGPAPLPGEIVVAKQYASGFFGTSLASTLRALGIDTPYVFGFSTSGCVRATALDALQHGFRPQVIADASGDREEATHDQNLFDLNAKYADVVSEAEVLSRFEALAAQKENR